MNIGLIVTIAIVGGTIHTNDGPPLKNASVLIQDGLIQAVGTDLALPKGTKKIDAKGAVITPGLIEPWTQLGLVEIWGVEQTRDGDAGGRRRRHL